jgi:hypothetical protein
VICLIREAFDFEVPVFSAGWHSATEPRSAPRRWFWGGSPFSFRTFYTRSGIWAGACHALGSSCVNQQKGNGERRSSGACGTGSGAPGPWRRGLAHGLP